MTQQFNQQERDPRIWEMARRRAGFRRQLFLYFAVMAFLWLIWYFTGARTYNRGVPWPVWPMAGWGLGLAFQYFNAFHGNGEEAIEREYNRLKNKSH